MTNSPMLLGLNWLFQSVPFICSSMVAGAVADRMNRRKLLDDHANRLVYCLVHTSGACVSWDSFRSGRCTCSARSASPAQVLSPLPDRPSFPVSCPRRHLASAIALHTSLHRSTSVIGPVLGGICHRRFRRGWSALVEHARLRASHRLGILDARRSRRPHPAEARCGNPWWTGSCTFASGRCSGGCSCCRHQPAFSPATPPCCRSMHATFCRLARRDWVGCIQ